ncbi:Imm1 family immunity protein [Actinopolyspora saharensis]|uniref:Immunity protein Imm1 n=1 Tax=Actinopolyspora saharensis TaxID=995062 RepID=A0A1H1H6W1_9ACTN|nr:Imm1 family immunity protein [Actinopolyspora saharensis]SDR21222.1 Immunity protein Imm1 [Actinopolyspora saharensis]
MTVTAVWPIDSPDAPNGGDGVTLTDPSEVSGLLSRLAEPGAGVATVWHEHREPADEETGMLDHDVCVAVRDGYGYLSYIDVEHDLAVPRGEPESPALVGEDVEFPAGSGVELGVLAEALSEFLRTGRRPESVDWSTVEE